MADILGQNFLDQYFREKVGENIYRRVPYEDVLKQHPAYPALDLDRVQTGTIGGDLAGQYNRVQDITTLDPRYTNPNRITKYDLQKLMHETTHRAMNVDPNVVAALGVSARNIPYSGKYKKSTGFVPAGGGWEWNPKDFGFGEGPTLKPSDPSEIFTRRVDVDAWDGKIAKQGEFMTDIEVADAVKANKLFHDPILDRKTNVHWQTRGAGAAPGESLRARTGIRSVFDPYVDKFKEAMTKYKGGENYTADYLEARKQGISTEDYIESVKEELGGFDNYLEINQNLGVNQKRFKQQQLMNQKIQQQKKKIGMPQHLTHTPQTPTPTPAYTGPVTHSFDPKQDTGQRPDKPGGFTDPGKGSYGPHMAYGGRASYFDGGLLSLWPR